MGMSIINGMSKTGGILTAGQQTPSHGLVQQHNQPQFTQYSSTKKLNKPNTASGTTKRLTSQSPSGSEIAGRTPGKIFSSGGSSSAQQTGGATTEATDNAYSNLMKNLSPQFKSMNTSPG